MDHPLTLLVGTTKGAFLLGADASRTAWDVRGPFCAGWAINHLAGDPDTGALWAAGGGEWTGAGIWCSEDGADWTLTKLSRGKIDDFVDENPEMAAQFGMKPTGELPFTGEIDALWSVALSHGTLYAGSKPAALFSSSDRGRTWEKVRGLTDHPTARDWQPGGAGLTLHTIVGAPDDPDRIWVGISAAGVFATEDGGRTWDQRNRRSNAPTNAEPDIFGVPADELGGCVHNMVRAPANGGGGDLLYQQNHHGVFRSRDGGRSWDEITDGLPSHFGFPIAVHPRDPQTLWVLPLTEDEGRFPPDNAAAVWTSRDGGESWTAQRAGLPERNCFFTVLRQAMTTDKATPAGLYFGTNSGSVFASADEGESWSEIARHLPTVLCVETLQRA